MKNAPKIPNFFIVGAPKSGTTAMFEYLERHPDVYVPIEKEPHFFAPDLYEHTSRDPTREQYLALFSAATDQRRIGEASTLYLASRVAATGIAAFNPSAKIVAMLRNPLDVVYAFHHQALYTGTHVVGDPRDPLAAMRYTFIGEYSAQLERYFHAFGRENVHVIVFDDFRADSAGVFRAVLDFLEVQSDIAPALAPVNEFKEVRFRWLKNLTQEPPRLASELVQRLPRGTYRRLMSFVESIHSKRARRPPMPPALEARLREHFAPEIERLSVLLGRDLGGWLASTPGNPYV